MEASRGGPAGWRLPGFLLRPGSAAIPLVSAGLAGALARIQVPLSHRLPPLGLVSVVQVYLPGAWVMNSSRVSRGCDQAWEGT